MANIGANLVGGVGNIANTFTPKTTITETGGEGGFKQIMTDALERLNNLSDENAQATLDLMTGNTDDLSNTMITAQKSEIALNLTVAIRDKAIGAYKEIMNMQV